LVASLYLFIEKGVRFWVVIVAACLATIGQYSYPGGIAAWGLLPLFIVLGWPHEIRRSAPKLGMLIAIGMFATGAYFIGYQHPSHHPPISAISDQSPIEIFLFPLAFLGNLFRSNRAAAASLGAVSLLLFTAIAISRHRSPGNGEPCRGTAAWITLGVYSLSQAGMATIGRLPMGFLHASRPDYVMHTVYFFVAIAVLWLSPNPTTARPVFLRSAVLAVVTVVASIQAASVLRADFWNDLERISQTRRLAKACLLLKEMRYDAECLTELYPVPEALNHRKQLAVESGVLDLAPISITEQAGDTDGHMERVEIAGDSLRASGWAAQRGRPADAVVLCLLCPAEPLAVLAITGTGGEPPDLSADMGSVRRRSGWEVEVEGDRSWRDDCQLAAYAMDNDNARLHRLRDTR
jgi:hypothetical protein